MSGNLAAVLAFVIWGFVPLFWKLLKSVPATEILCHRIMWSAIFLLLPFIFDRQKLRRYIPRLKNKRTLGLLALSAIFITTNWLIYIWAVNAGFVLETSLGYYINPFISIAMGMLVFGERLRKWQWVALSFAFSGVACAAISLATFPWIALSLAMSFALYGLLRKLTAMDSLVSLLVETWFVAPFCLLYVVLAEQETHATAIVHSDAWIKFLLISCGIITSAPLLFFGYAATRIPLSRIGFLQFISPTMQFCIAIGVFHEEFSVQHFFTFTLIFIGIAIYLYDLTLSDSQKRKISRNR